MPSPHPDHESPPPGAPPRADAATRRGALAPTDDADARGAHAASRPIVLIAEPIDEPCIAWLSERADVRVVTPSHERFAPALHASDGLLVRTYVRVDDALLAGAPRLRVVARAGVGLDNIDLAACARRGVRVVSTPGANTWAVVEFVLATILDHTRPRAPIHAPPTQAEWHAARKHAIAPHELPELTLGILGLGRIGSTLARVAAALGMRVIYHDLLDIPPPQRHGAAPVSLPTLLGESDILSIHVDGRPDNRHLVNAHALALLRPHALLINTSRGMVVDAHALARHLRAFPGARAALDVHDPEPVERSNPLLELPGARLTPHIASATSTAKRHMSWVVRDLWEALASTAPRPGEPRPIGPGPQAPTAPA